MFLRKAHAGADSYGNEWPHDGAVVEVDDAQGLDLLRIVDAGFSVAEPLPPTGSEVTEPAPPPATPVTEPAPRRPSRPRKPSAEGTQE